MLNLKKILVFIPVVLLLCACSLTRSSGTATPAPVGTGGEEATLPPVGIADLGGTWTGTLSDQGKGSTYDLELTLAQAADNTVSGGINITSVNNLETYIISGDFDGTTLHFQESDGRFFTASLAGDTLNGYVGWDEYDKPESAWGQYTLTRGTSALATQPPEELTEPPVSKTIHAPTSTEVFLPTATHGTFRFLNLVDGGSIAGSYDDQGRARVMVQFETSGANVVLVYMVENELLQLGEVDNSNAQDPFQDELAWYPSKGAGNYTLLASAMLDDKSFLEQTVHVSVTGIPVFTPTPPPLDLAGAQQRISEIIQQEYGVYIPKPTVYRFDSPQYPTFSRWIGSAWYNGYFYYIDLFDDAHYQDNGRNPYADSSHKGQTTTWVYCKPAGLYKLLVLFVDYNNLLTDPPAALAEVQLVTDWMNTLYADFARSQGLSAAVLTLEAEAAVVSPPPVPGEPLTADQVRSLTGKEPNDYDLFIEIDLDPTHSFADDPNFPSGGGLALQGCAVSKEGIINAWSSLPDDTEIEGALTMDLNHELSHLFGMKDSWPFAPAALFRPNGTTADDWIPYPMFGWTDADGDGVIEILDPTPYGTNGPQP